MRLSLRLAAAACLALLGVRGEKLSVSLRMQDAVVDGDDMYMACSTTLPSTAAHIVRFEPVADMSVVHHMLLYLCTEAPLVSQSTGKLNMMHQRCPSGEMLAYGWGRNAPALTLPDDVGFEVGEGGFAYAVLEMHYLRPPGGKAGGADSSGVILHLTTDPVEQAAGILMFASGFVIPALSPSYRVPMQCCYDGPQPLTAVAFRVHTHLLGRLVYLERGHEAVAALQPALVAGAEEGAGDANPALLLRRSPLLPQAFSLISEQPHLSNPGAEQGGGDSYVNSGLRGSLVVRPGTLLRATCRFNSSTVDHPVSAGSTHNDEMCNLYLMFSAHQPASVGCYADGRDPTLLQSGPVNVEHSAADPLAALSHGWAPPEGTGQVSGLDFAPDGRSLWLFQRGERVWDGSSYDDQRNSMRNSTPIDAACVLRVDAGSGAVLQRFGERTFSMPHGLTVDADGNVWVTDTGLHQVLKFSPTGKLLLELGTRMVPGSGPAAFCKPTHVAVGSDGSFFVADGYCNSRVVAFRADGSYLGEWTGKGLDSPATLAIPHALALDECADILYVADRENGRVIRIPSATTTLPSEWTAAGGWRMEKGDKGGLPYGLQRVPGGDLYALTWQRDRFGSGGAVRLLRLPGGRALSGWVSPSDSWEVPDVRIPHHMALAPLPGGGPGLALYVGETRPAAQPAPAVASPSRLALGHALPACVIWPAACSAAEHGRLVEELGKGHKHTGEDALRRLSQYLARRKQEGIAR